MRAALIGALLLLGAGCAPLAPPPPQGGADAGEAGGAQSPAGSLSAAGSALLVQSRNERRSGEYARAAATLERALRIEPTAPAIWLELARLRLVEGNLRQAEQLARKAQSLAGERSPLAAESRAVIAEALRRQGRGNEVGTLP